MNVFLVLGVFKYESITVLGIYDSFEKAHDALVVAATSPAYPPLPNLMYDRVEIDEREVK